MKRIAIPVYNGKLSEYFGRCSYYKIYEVEGKSMIGKELELPDINSIEELPAWASTKGITDIITYKIDKQIISLFNAYKINLFVGIEMNTPENLIREFLDERMTSDNRIITEIIENK